MKSIPKLSEWRQRLAAARISIRSKLMAIISAIVLLSLLLLTIGNLGLFESEMSDMVSFVQSRSTKLLAEKVDADLDRRISEIRVMHNLRMLSARNAALLVRTYMKKNSDNLYMAAYNWSNIRGSSTSYFSRMYDLYSPQLLAEQKVTLQQIRRTLAIAKNFLSLALGGDVVLRNISPAFKKPVWILCTPLQAGHSAAVNVYSGEQLGRIFGGAKVTAAGVANSLFTSFLVDSEGHLIIHPDEQKVLQSVNVEEDPVVKAMFESPASHGAMRFKEKDETLIGAFQKLNTAEIGVITTVARAKAMEGVDLARTSSILISLLIIACAILFVYYFAKSMSEPLKKLVKATEQIKEGDYETRLEATANDEIGDVSLAFNHMAEGLKEREKLKGAFGKFVNKEIAEQILAGDLHLGGEQKNATIYFSDIRKFTALSERWEPVQVVDFLNSYMSRVVADIHANQGVVDKFIGDAVMAVWGIPNEKPNDALNCVNAALQIRKTLIEYNSDRGTRERPMIHVGCGINTGPVLAGQIGSENRLEYTVIGDAVNTASRMEALCKRAGCDILLSESTYEQVKDHFKVLPTAPVKVKGKKEEMRAYVVLGHKNDANTPNTLEELREMLGIQVLRIGDRIKVHYEIIKK